MSREPTQEYLHECFDYIDGRLYWKERPRHHFNNFNAYLRQKKPKIVNNKDLYPRVRINGEIFKQSRIIYVMEYGEIPEGSVIDHIDGNPRNNKIENLRCTKQRENMYNKKKYKNNKSGYNGIDYCGGDKIKPWRCRYVENYKRKTKTFGTKQEAIEFRKSRDEMEPYITERHGK